MTCDLWPVSQSAALVQEQLKRKRQMRKVEETLVALMPLVRPLAACWRRNCVGTRCA